MWTTEGLLHWSLLHLLLHLLLQSQCAPSLPALGKTIPEDKGRFLQPNSPRMLRGRSGRNVAGPGSPGDGSAQSLARHASRRPAADDFRDGVLHSPPTSLCMTGLPLLLSAASSCCSASLWPFSSCHVRSVRPVCCRIQRQSIPRSVHSRRWVLERGVVDC